MDREQHITQDAAEIYAVHVLQHTTEDIGRAIRSTSPAVYDEFRDYIAAAGLSVDEFSSGKYRQYKANIDSQLPPFAQRVADQFPGANFEYKNVEKEYRNLGLKGDFLLTVTTLPDPYSVAQKNYIGTGGITRPQVGSGTYSSFAQGFVFSRVGVGTYLDPRDGSKFQGANAQTRNEILQATHRAALIPILAELDACQVLTREQLLADDRKHYNREHVRETIKEVSSKGIQATLALIDALGPDHVKSIILQRSGLDGKEEALFFDNIRHIDSITNPRYHDFRAALNDDETQLLAYQQKQGIRFEFRNNNKSLLKIDVPFTINTNGAWFRPKERYEGTQQYNDKGHLVDLVWGERRPYKSKEIATSTNMYVDLTKTGIFG